MMLHLPKGYQDPSNTQQDKPSFLEVSGMWATLACTALCVILMIYKLLAY
jgi:hypothetical protein